MKTRDINIILHLRQPMLLIVVAFFCLFDVVPKLWRMQIVKEQMAIEQQGVRLLSPAARQEQEKKIKAETDEFSRQIKLLEEKLTMIRQKATDEKNIAMSTLEIEDMAVAAKVTVTSIKPTREMVKERYVLLPQEVGVRGEYAALLDFLTKLDGANTAMAVEGLSVRRANMDDKTLDMNLKLYVLLSDAGERRAVGDAKGVAK